MSQKRRRFLAGAGVALGGSLAGCVGFLKGEKALEFSAKQGAVAQAALDDTGYGEHKLEEFPVEKTYKDRTVKVTNWYHEYDRAIELDLTGRFQGAVFAVLTTPKVEVPGVGKALNPVEDKGRDWIVQQVQNRYENVKNVTGVGEYTHSILGSQTAVGEYEADAEVAAAGISQTVELAVHVSDPIDHGDDFVIVVAAYPKRLPGEKENVQTLMGGVQHEG